MKIKRTESLCIEIKDKMYWAEIYIKPWIKGNGFSICIRSDFGTWANAWSAPGEGGYLKFLPEINMHYAYEKFVGSRVFDPYIFEKEAKKMLLEERRNGQINSDLAKEAWDELIKALESGDNPMNYLYHNQCCNYWADPCTYTDLGMTMDRSFVNFWEVFWGPFCEFIQKNDGANLY